MNLDVAEEDGLYEIHQPLPSYKYKAYDSWLASAHVIWTFGLHISLLMHQPETRRKNTVVWEKLQNSICLSEEPETVISRSTLPLILFRLIFLLMSSGQAIAELLVLDLFLG